MGNGPSIDAVPVASQVKSACQAGRGDCEGANQTQQHFLQRCPLASQVTSAAQAAQGDLKAAKQTQQDFLLYLPETLASVTAVMAYPVVAIVLAPMMPVAATAGLAVAGAAGAAVIIASDSSETEQLLMPCELRRKRNLRDCKGPKVEDCSDSLIGQERQNAPPLSVEPEEILLLEMVLQQLRVESHVVEAIEEVHERHEDKPSQTGEAPLRHGQGCPSDATSSDTCPGAHQLGYVPPELQPPDVGNSDKAIKAREEDSLMYMEKTIVVPRNAQGMLGARAPCTYMLSLTCAGPLCPYMMMRQGLTRWRRRRGWRRRWWWRTRRWWRWWW